MTDQIISTILVSVATGVVSTTGTVIALKVHITYLREAIARHEAAITRAHARIDTIERHRSLETC
ncbi:hypothetical protein HBA55_34455 [Pseudomaricurvus alkylphenolicus]|uniref:hypothetical protein n=1 Tax=Pseudomaricurvus alkylphenolicus TaxID=1306991 RepID=UPI001422982B|nr:hypothetical protein [Pseudomaricurvus alkylphenolicus]NIB44733.1 hypothetical protein [Pseudomaricurvus alkylphenolicus]